MSNPEENSIDHARGKSESENTQDDGSDVKQWLRPNTPPEVVDRIRRIVAYHRGPLPPASEFRDYENTYPGAADRILGMAEKNQELQGKSIDGEIGLARRRISASTTVSLAVVALGGLAIMFDPAWLAMPLGGFGDSDLISTRIDQKDK